MEYTEKIHAQRLLKMLNKKDPCLCCPASKFFGTHGEGNWGEYQWWEPKWDKDPCGVCWVFIEGKPREGRHCPCAYFAKKDALKLTWLALEEKGYL